MKILRDKYFAYNEFTGGIMTGDSRSSLVQQAATYNQLMGDKRTGNQYVVKPRHDAYMELITRLERDNPVLLVDTDNPEATDLYRRFREFTGADEVVSLDELFNYFSTEQLSGFYEYLKGSDE